MAKKKSALKKASAKKQAPKKAAVKKVTAKKAAASKKAAPKKATLKKAAAVAPQAMGAAVAIQGCCVFVGDDGTKYCIDDWTDTECTNFGNSLPTHNVVFYPGGCNIPCQHVFVPK